MMDFDERVIPGITANFQFKESLARYEFASKILRGGSYVLDLGCGTGYGSDFLSRKFNVIGIDINKEAISFAKKHYPNSARFLVGDVCRLPFEREEFDAICSFEVIEHIKNPKDMLSEVLRVLKKRGLFVMSTPKKGKKVISPYHFKEYTKVELENLLRLYFSKVEIFGQCKNKKAKKAFLDFLKSQQAREKVVRNDVLGLRRLFPKILKEKIWKYVGNFFGRRSQESLETSDFPIGAFRQEESEFLIAVCQK
jgi:ubiquinone/menaquinone biosynthesis C-methylase UbiE